MGIPVKIFGTKNLKVCEDSNAKMSSIILSFMSTSKLEDQNFRSALKLEVLDFRNVLKKYFTMRDSKIQWYP